MLGVLILYGIVKLLRLVFLAFLMLMIGACGNNSILLWGCCVRLIVLLFSMMMPSPNPAKCWEMQVCKNEWVRTYGNILSDLR
jgi:hypothetical protein